MFRIRPEPRSTLVAIVTLCELIYHGVVRNVRKKHGNPLASLVLNVVQTLILVLVFYVMFAILSLRHIAIRGDFLIYLMTGIFLYMTHIKTIGAVAGAEGPASPMMQHAPMSPAIAILSASLGALYIQFLSMAVVLFGYFVGVRRFEVEDPMGCLGMVLLAWFTGSAIGLVLYGLKPWAPSLVGIVSTIYQRANMIASGKMFVANSLPPFMVAMFDWNPLFHAIDQARGYAFVNYHPRNSNPEYPIVFGLVFLVLGMMLIFYTRRRASMSWSARG